MRIITSLTDQPADRPVLSEIGRLATGFTDQGQNGVEFPRSTDYFVVRSEFAEPFNQLLGEKPASLSILFISDDPNFSCNERLEIRDHKGNLFAYGDGSTFYFFDVDLKTYSKVCTVEKHPDIMDQTVTHLQKGLVHNKAKTIKWRDVLYLRFMIRDFPVLGYWQYVTHAKRTTIPALRDTFDGCLKTFGTVTKIPFLLRVKKVKSNNPGDCVQFPVVQLLPMISMEEGYRLSGRPSPILPELEEPSVSLLESPHSDPVQAV